MTLARFGTAAALIMSLTGAASAMPAISTPERPATPLESVQWRHHNDGRGHHYGWRHHHGPRCWTERIVHRTPWGPRVDYRRVCR